jgi:hypothetical protein
VYTKLTLQHYVKQAKQWQAAQLEPSLPVRIGESSSILTEEPISELVELAINGLYHPTSTHVITHSLQFIHPILSQVFASSLEGPLAVQDLTGSFPAPFFRDPSTATITTSTTIHDTTSTTSPTMMTMMIDEQSAHLNHHPLPAPPTLPPSFTEVLPQPSILLGYQDEWLKGTSTLLHYWEKTRLEPYSPKKNITYFALCPQNPNIISDLTAFFSELSSIYEVKAKETK